MSLSPSERVEVRRNRFKVAVDAEEGRRRREDNMVELRKSRREESLQKRRREGMTQAQQSIPFSSTGTTHSSAVVEKKVRQVEMVLSLGRGGNGADICKVLPLLLGM